MITENIFSSRFRHVDELRRMGANIRVEGRNAIFEGPASLQGASVKMTDLRAGAALVTAALSAEGISQISEIHHIDRGYENLEKKLVKLGAKVWRVFEE